MQEEARRCTSCGNPMTEAEADDAHWPHDRDCPQRSGTADDCRCANEVHEECCWECRPELNYGEFAGRPANVAAVLPMQAVARKTDPGTSWAAAKSVSNLRTSQAHVLEMFELHGRMHDEELIEAYDKTIGSRPIQSPSGLRTRRKELVDAGFLVDTGEKVMTRSGRMTIVWGMPKKETLF